MVVESAATAQPVSDAQGGDESFLIRKGAPPWQFHSARQGVGCFSVWNCCSKRLLDIAASASALCLLMPFLLFIAASIRLTSRGPVLFRQKRYGMGGVPFEILKFRTMYTDKADRSGVKQTRAYDRRVTPLGAWLRRTNIDELPQLVNVLRGEMSLVGPRPHVPRMMAGGVLYEDLVPHYFQRCATPPGITGLAQAVGLRGSTEDPRLARERIEYDLVYIQHRSLLLDLRILCTTLRNECLRGSGM